MFDPRKLMPLSIEDWSAPMAVITEITEKTPIVMPIIVSAARSLLAPNDARAILMISLNNIEIYLPQRTRSSQSGITGLPLQPNPERVDVTHVSVALH